MRLLHVLKALLLSASSTKMSSSPHRSSNVQASYMLPVTAVVDAADFSVVRCGSARAGQRCPCR